MMDLMSLDLEYEETIEAGYCGSTVSSHSNSSYDGASPS